MSGIEMELIILWTAVGLYVMAGMAAFGAVVLGLRFDRIVLVSLVAALGVHALAIGLRWVRLEHGPFITMFEVLSGNVWSLTAVFTLVFWRIPAIRPSAVIVLPIVFVMIAWLLVMHPGEGFFPPTYRTPLLYLHILFGKVFLGSVVVAVGLSGVILLRFLGRPAALSSMPGNRSLEELAYRFLGLALIFDTLMLITGAIWAQDAWGRYWAWDPLETWAFLNWLLIGFALHARLAFRPRPSISAVMVTLVFVLAFLTFFGVPFVSTSFHKGAL